ncbi:MAG: AraC family transcriptional regulator [Proteobacteria bacterium]|nr:AraC family transcriptional regulator [Pseudomonadota bacterium]MCL2307093.1 AraC family transcriptional regulator [Pseudomonadota bacterium]
MRNDTKDTYRQKANQVIDYISANLHQPLALDKLAGEIHVSQRQLLRIMRLFLEESLYAYVARQRIERAVLYMQTEETGLAELAEMVGYESPQSFSKAFKKQFGTSPKAYMSELRARLENFAKSGDGKNSPLQPDVCEENDLELVYIRIIGKYGESEPYEATWNKLLCFLGDHRELSEETRFIGISFDNPNVTSHKRCRYYACATVKKRISPRGEFGTIQLRRGKYAVYTLKGSYSGLQALYNNISVDFSYQLRHGAAFEEYLNSPRDTKEENLLTRVFIPIR